MSGDVLTLQGPEIAAPDLAEFQRLFELRPQAAAEVAQIIDRAEQVGVQMYVGDPATQTQVTQLAEAARWRFLGKPGDPLPSTFVIVDGGERQSEIVLDPRLDPALTSRFDSQLNGIYAANDEDWRSEIYRGAEDLLVRSMTASATEKLLQSVIAPDPFERERLLKEYEKAWRETQLIGSLTLRYGTDPLGVPMDAAGFVARRELTIGKFMLDDATTRGIVLGNEQPPHIRARMLVGSMILALHNGDNPNDSPLTDPFKITAGQGSLQYEGRQLSTRRIAEFLEGQDADPAAYEYSREAILRLFDGGCEDNYAATFYEAKWNTSQWIWRNIRNGLTNPGSSLPSDVAWWLRAPDTTSSVVLSKQQYENLASSERKRRTEESRYHSRDEGIVPRDELERDLSTVIGRIEIDQRSDEELRATRLIMQIPRANTQLLNDDNAEPVLRLRFLATSAERQYARNVPYIPGFRLNTETRDGAEVVYDFIRDTAPDPYRFCALELGDPERGEAAELFANNEATTMVEYVLATPLIRIGGLEQAIAARSDYFTPPTETEARRHHRYFATNGRLQLQCTTAASVLQDALRTGAYNGRWTLRPVAGAHTLPRARQGEIVRAGHRQLLVTTGEETYFLDATPSYSQSSPPSTPTGVQSPDALQAAIAGLKVSAESAEQAIDPVRQSAKTSSEYTADAQSELARHRQVFETLMVREFNLEPHRNRSLVDRIWQYVADNRLRDGDPVGMAGRIIYHLTPIAEDGPLDADQLTTQIQAIDDTLDYLSHFKKTPRTVRLSYGIECSDSLAEALTSILLTVRIHAYTLRAELLEV